MVLTDKKVARAAQKIANLRMRAEILPLLSRPHSRPNSWNPLRIDFSGKSATLPKWPTNAPFPSANETIEGVYQMKLWLPDKLAMEILRTPALLEKTGEIVVESTLEAAMDESRAFVTSILDYLMCS